MPIAGVCRCLHRIGGGSSPRGYLDFIQLSLNVDQKSVLQIQLALLTANCDLLFFNDAALFFELDTGCGPDCHLAPFDTALAGAG